MAKKTKSKIEEIEAKNRMVDIKKLVMMNAESNTTAFSFRSLVEQASDLILWKTYRVPVL